MAFSVYVAHCDYRGHRHCVDPDWFVGQWYRSARRRFATRSLGCFGIWPHLDCGLVTEIVLLLSELDIADENGPKLCVIILANRDKVEMEDAVRAKLPHLKNTRIVTRSGEPSDPAVLTRVAPLTAWLATQIWPRSIKTCSILTGQRFTSRQSLSRWLVRRFAMSFVHLMAEPSSGFERDGCYDLTPSPSEVLRAGDVVVLLAETATSAIASTATTGPWTDPMLTFDIHESNVPDTIGIVGWSELGARVLNELDHVIPPNSRVV